MAANLEPFDPLKRGSYKKSSKSSSTPRTTNNGNNNVPRAKKTVGRDESDQLRQNQLNAQSSRRKKIELEEDEEDEQEEAENDAEEEEEETQSSAIRATKRIHPKSSTRRTEPKTVPKMKSPIVEEEEQEEEDDDDDDDEDNEEVEAVPERARGRVSVRERERAKRAQEAAISSAKAKQISKRVPHPEVEDSDGAEESPEEKISQRKDTKRQHPTVDSSSPRQSRKESGNIASSPIGRSSETSNKKNSKGPVSSSVSVPKKKVHVEEQNDSEEEEEKIQSRPKASKMKQHQEESDRAVKKRSHDISRKQVAERDDSEEAEEETSPVEVTRKSLQSMSVRSTAKSEGARNVSTKQLARQSEVKQPRSTPKTLQHHEESEDDVLEMTLDDLEQGSDSDVGIAHRHEAVKRSNDSKRVQSHRLSSQATADQPKRKIIRRVVEEEEEWEEDVETPSGRKSVNSPMPHPSSLSTGVDRTMVRRKPPSMEEDEDLFDSSTVMGRNPDGTIKDKSYWRIFLNHTKSRMGFNKNHVTWRFVWKGIPHVVELIHSTLSGKRTIILDGITKISEKKMLDNGSKYHLDAGSKQTSVLLCVEITPVGVSGVSYECYIDGKDYDRAKQHWLYLDESRP